ncbi:MAG: hypothetical protein JW820_00295 [Spirochaetales bacterium]|nr:hypothetical protein [Spirochaetales bacterium]
MDPISGAGGSKLWFVADGYLPLQARTDDSGFEGHEAIMILNCNDREARVRMDVYFEDHEPIEGVELSVPARRVRCFRMDHPQEIGGVQIERLEQYALRFRSDIEVVVQYGRMDVSQANLAYIGMMAHSG